MVYVMMGGPATGKGTRSKILAEAKGIAHIATGDMLRKVALKDESIREKLSNGELISDEVTTKLLEERIKEEDCQKGFVLDGYPRTYEQALLLDELLEKNGKHVDIVMELEVSDDLAIRRILERKKCMSCGEAYGLDFPSKSKNYCDKCGGRLMIRTDDTKETLMKRIETYKENSKEILEYYNQKEILRKVDASTRAESVVSDVE